MHYNSIFVLSKLINKYCFVISFCLIRTIYDKLKIGVRNEDDKQMFDQRIDEITTNARFCQYKSGDKNAARELRNLRTKAALDDPEMTRVLDVGLTLFFASLTLYIRFSGIS